MANWQFKFEFGDLMGAFNDGKLTIYEMSQKVIERIDKELIPQIKEKQKHLGDDYFKPYVNFSELLDTLGEIQGSFADITDDVFDEMDAEMEFDGVLNDFYDWGDTALDSKWPIARVCWIQSF